MVRQTVVTGIGKAVCVNAVPGNHKSHYDVGGLYLYFETSDWGVLVFPVTCEMLASGSPPPDDYTWNNHFQITDGDTRYFAPVSIDEQSNNGEIMTIDANGRVEYMKRSAHNTQ
jgi:hypothetical protein